MVRILGSWIVAMIFMPTALNNGSCRRICAQFAKQQDSILQENNDPWKFDVPVGPWKVDTKRVYAFGP